jgi:dihydrofolate synthase/folylpolyglutamate synthase
MAHLGNPERKFRSIHVAGTNGKGSVSHMLASVLMQAGYKVGLYTSPHLVDFRERIRINGQMIPQEQVTDFVELHRGFMQTLQLSFFEMTVGLAFDYFAKEQVDVAVVEVGMGGRLDSTNVIRPDLCVITNIGYDHTQFLGDTLAKIAGEKAGIIKSGVPVVIGESHPDTKPVFEAKAAEMGATIFFADDKYTIVETKLPADNGLDDYDPNLQFTVKTCDFKLWIKTQE